MTRITINLPLVDARLCKGCHMAVSFYTTLCVAFGKHTQNGERLPECLAAEVEEVERG